MTITVVATESGANIEVEIEAYYQAVLAYKIAAAKDGAEEEVAAAKIQLKAAKDILAEQIGGMCGEATAATALDTMKVDSRYEDSIAVNGFTRFLGEILKNSIEALVAQKITAAQRADATHGLPDTVVIACQFRHDSKLDTITIDVTDNCGGLSDKAQRTFAELTKDQDTFLALTANQSDKSSIDPTALGGRGMGIRNLIAYVLYEADCQAGQLVQTHRLPADRKAHLGVRLERQQIADDLWGTHISLQSPAEAPTLHSKHRKVTLYGDDSPSDAPGRPPSHPVAAAAAGGFTLLAPPPIRKKKKVKPVARASSESDDSSERTALPLGKFGGPLAAPKPAPDPKPDPDLADATKQKKGKLDGKSR